MNLRRIIYEAADTLRATPICKANEIAVIELEKGDIIAKVRAELGRLSRCVVVSLDRFMPTATGGDGLYGRTGLIVSVFEKPVVNRADEGDVPLESPGFDTSPTVLNIAQACANALDRTKCEGMNGALFLDEITPVVELTEDGFQGCVTCDVVLSAKDICIS
jgi:hypothetical protein